MGISIKLDRISKSFNEHKVLYKCSYEFQEGKTYILIGENGCGKSTLLRLCAFLDFPDNGIINYIGNKELLPVDLTLKRKITLVQPGLDVLNNTVFDNTALGLYYRGVKKNDIKDRVQNILEYVQLEHKKRQKAFTLSSGEKKRLAIARAIVLEPSVLLLDEPTAYVDKANAELIESIISDLQEKNMTIILATHELSYTKKVKSHIITIENSSLKLINC